MNGNSPYTSVFDRMLSLSRAMDQAFGSESGTTGSRSSQLWLPPVDVYETGDSFIIESDLPGVHPENVDISFEQNTLTISGTRAPTLPARENNELRVYTAERVNGTFARTVRLPEYVDGEKIEASFANGVLTVTVPKAPSALPRKIAVRTNEATETQHKLNA